MIIARIIRKWFRPQDDFAALGERLRQLRAGEIDRLELPPGVRYQALLPECPKCGYRPEGGAAPTVESEIEEVNESLDRIEAVLEKLRHNLVSQGLIAPSTQGLH